MTDQALDILKLVLLGLLYLFFARVLWAVWSEVKATSEVAPGVAANRRAAAVTAPVDDASPAPKVPRGKGTLPARLTVIEPKERAGTTFAIEGSITIGREPGNTIVILDDDYISGHHATVMNDGDRVLVLDQSSRNGTFVNGARLTQSHTLRRGDRIQVGYTVLEAQ